MTHPMISGTCLCGAVSFTHAAPEKLVRCNCAACRRYGTLWAHGPLDTIAITANGPTTRYVRTDSDGDLAFVSCATCGITTHWEPTSPQNGPAYMAVNAALCDPTSTANLRIRHFDGADTFEYLD
jgi:hypothetical protein